MQIMPISEAKKLTKESINTEELIKKINDAITTAAKKGDATVSIPLEEKEIIEMTPIVKAQGYHVSTKTLNVGDCYDHFVRAQTYLEISW